jgi:hypothetical protein
MGCGQKNIKMATFKELVQNNQVSMKQYKLHQEQFNDIKIKMKIMTLKLNKIEDISECPNRNICG